MELRTCGKSGLRVSAITLGLMVRDCAPGAAFESVRATIRRAVELGVNTIDLATGYGGGAVERAVGEVLRRDFAGRRGGLILATKAGWADGSRKTLTESLEKSLLQLGVEYVDVYYHHAPDASTPISETAAALDDLVRQGKTRYVGVSNYSLAETIAIIAEFRRLGTPCALHQCNYNLLNRWVEDGLLQGLPALGMSAAVFSVVNQGVLSDATLTGLRPGSRAERSLHALVEGVPTGEPAYGRYAAGDVRAQVMATLRELSEIARERGQTLSQLAVAWALRHPQVATALIGASSPAQIEEAATAAGQPPLTQEERVRIARSLPPRWGMI
jgi:L-glyceraldehyde 3-phosphate reductase